MSKETYEWLGRNIRIGFTDDDGPAWWLAGAERIGMAEGSHFPGSVPADIARELLSVPLVEAKLHATYEWEGVREVASAPDRKGIVRADTGELLGVFKSGYAIHGYDEWTMRQLELLLDANLGIKSVGLLRKGAQAWIQARLTTEYEVNGYGFTPFILAATSCDGSLATTYATGIDAAVCDNTLGAAIMCANTKTKVRHTSKSAGRVVDLRASLGLQLAQVADEFTAGAEALMAIPVTEAEFSAWMDMEAPMPAKKSEAKPGRGWTLAATKREALLDLRKSPMVAPWDGTVFGVAQLANTWRTWNRTVQGADGGRMERFYVDMVNGKTDTADLETLGQLSKVLGRTLVNA
jgi:phage/plasmid-like protein (TIGR03299 family)